MDRTERPVLLLVDDAPLNIQVLAQALQDDYQIKIATNGIDALQIARSHHPVLILLDIMMPEMDGYEVCRQLKEDLATREIPVIFVTAKGDIEDEHKGLSIGAVDYIPKPFALDIVKARIKTQLDLQQQRLLVQRLHQQVAEREKIFHIIAEEASECSFYRDASGKYVYMTPACAELTGYSREEFTQASDILYQLIDPEDQAQFAAFMEEDSKRPEQGVEMRLYRRDGEERWVLLNATKVHDDEGCHVGCRASLIDITERRNFTMALQHEKKRADEANRAKSAFLATMSHELRTPLNGIIGNAELLGRGTLDAQQRHKIETVQHSAKSLLTIIGNILDFTHIEAGDFVLEQRVFSIVQLLQDVCSILTPEAESKGVKLDWSVATDLQQVRRGDPERIEQILLNLGDNAIKFTHEDNPNAKVTLSAQQVADDVRFTVEDNGVGMAPEICGWLFQPFALGDDTPTRRYGGTGLGLTICDRLVSLMGGTINVESEVGQGSRISVELPLPLAADEEMHMETITTTASTKVSVETAAPILIAEDNETNQELILFQLQSLGYTAEVASDGREALSMWQSGHYSLILADCHMPTMDGYQMAAAIRELEKSDQHIPIVAITANVSAADEEQCRVAGMDDFLAKPVELPQLESCLEKWLATLPDDPMQPQVDVRESINGSPIDPLALAKLVGDDPSLHQKFLRKFVPQAQKIITDIHQAHRSHQADTVGELGHKLKSSALSVGAHTLADLCSGLERSGRAGEWAEIERLDPQLDDVMMAVSEYVTALEHEGVTQ